MFFFIQLHYFFWKMVKMTSERKPLLCHQHNMMILQDLVMVPVVNNRSGKKIARLFFVLTVLSITTVVVHGFHGNLELQKNNIHQTMNHQQSRIFLVQSSATQQAPGMKPITNCWKTRGRVSSSSSGTTPQMITTAAIRPYSQRSSSLYASGGGGGGFNDNNNDSSDFDKNNQDDHSSRDVRAINRARTDIRNFLTQRSIQSFQFLLTSCRDDATVNWLEKTYDFHNLENYHGTGAFNLTKYPTWDCILTDMLRREKNVIVIAAKRRGAGHGGWSKHNPYLQERFVEFEIDIDPPSLVSRIVSVREQLAREWTRDLSTLKNINEMILQEYTKRQSAERDDGVSYEGDDTITSSTYDSPDSSNYNSNSAVGLGYGAVTPSSPRRKVAYDRSHMQFISNTMAFEEQGSSPYRKGSFDLLSLLATQESIHRVLRQYRLERDRTVSYDWLRNYYVQRVVHYFDGNQHYGRSDDFLEELLLTSPLMKEVDNGRKVGLIDPLRIAEDIIETRSAVYADWKDIVTKVPETDHMDLRRVILAIQMGKTSWENESIFESNSISKQEALEDLGFFQ